MKEELVDASQLVSDKVLHWYNLTVSMLPNFVLAAVLLVVFYFFARLLKWFVYSGLLKRVKNKELKGIISRVVYFLVMVIGVMTSLSVLELDKTVTSILASVGIIGLALGFAFQDIASNFISGFFMAVNKPFHVGDIVDVKDHQGTITKLNIRTTELKTFEGNDVIIPNKDIFQSPIINYFSSPTRRVTVEVGVSYAENLEHVRDITLNAIKSLSFIIEESSCEVYFNEFSDSSINLEARFWIEYSHNAQFLSAKSEAILAIKRAYDKEGITIPFPIRTLDFGIKGGEKLNEVLEQKEEIKSKTKSSDKEFSDESKKRFQDTKDHYMPAKFKKPEKDSEPIIKPTKGNKNFPPDEEREEF